jgi:hypothetical protein
MLWMTRETGKDIRVMLSLLRKELPFDRSERKITLSDWWNGTDDPQVRVLTDELTRVKGELQVALVHKRQYQ